MAELKEIQFLDSQRKASRSVDFLDQGQTDDGINTRARKILPTFVTGAKPKVGEQTIMGDIFNRPGASAREAIRENPALVLTGPLAGLVASTGVAGKEAKQAASRGANIPDQSESFQDQFIKGAQESFGGPSKSVAVNFLKGLPASAAGLATDIATNPADALLNVLSFGAAGIAKGKQGLNATANAIKKSKPLAKRVDKPITKAIRPSVAGRKSANRIRSLKQDARLAVDTIVENKQNLSFVDDSGQAVSGRLPQNLDEFSQAVSQTKKDVFDTYSALKTKAGGELRIIDLDSIADEIAKGVDNVVAKDLTPETFKYAENLANTLKDRGFFSIDEAQEAVQVLNNRLKAFYRNPNPNDASKRVVDAAFANNLRKRLNRIIGEETGKNFGALKQRYGALAAIENDVNRRLIVDARRNARGLIDFTDIFSAGQIAEGIATNNPSSLIRGGVGLTVKNIISKANDPNRAIRKMFDSVDDFKSGGSIIRRSGVPVRGNVPASGRVLSGVNRPEQSGQPTR